jgi:aminopeptidase N
MTSAQTPGQRITFYRAYLNLASSAQARRNLKDILAGKSKLAVFQLRTKDKFDLVTRLLVLSESDAPRLLANLEKSETSDDAKRYAYAARAGIAAQDAKAKYFKDFMTNKELSESWIEAAFVPFNSVRHSDLTLPYLETALAELPNLKRTRKIFFVNGWLGAFIGGQKSEEALAIVNKFLADNQNLDKDLKLKILENADNLERAVKIRRKFSSQ